MGCYRWRWPGHVDDGADAHGLHVRGGEPRLDGLLPEQLDRLPQLRQLRVLQTTIKNNESLDAIITNFIGLR